MYLIKLPPVRRPSSRPAALSCAVALCVCLCATLPAQTYSFSTLLGAGLNSPIGVAVDSQTNVYVADTANHVIRKINAAGVVSVLAGSGAAGASDGRGTAASFNQPQGVAVDGAGNVYVADTANSLIRTITPAGVVSTLAGTLGYTGSADNYFGYSFFNQPTGIAVDRNGNNIYVADNLNHTIRLVTGYGVVSTLAGYPGNTGIADDTGSNARFNSPQGLALDPAGNVIVADFLNSSIRKVTPGGVVTTIAGKPQQPGFVDGTVPNAQFYRPAGVAVDAAGNIYVGDTYNNAIRKITPAGVVTTLGGNSSYTSGNGIGTAAGFYSPTGIAVGANGNLYIVDSNNNLIRLGTVVPPVITLATTGGQSVASMLANGFIVNVVLTNSVNYRIQASGDFKNWTDLSHVVGTSGTYQFLDYQSSPVAGRRFYRAISP